ncbi:hypothetical protein L228DRAFT_267833 [Xylona heveae TC161]|uniref:Actin cytoskeleton-regulatory complex protein SLA1 n=1 Tax=Xylona heveae (strain CBS 132557 / TC161) TaxID=1328760 RepID=A0A161U9G2_XYLHT|nr:hypothetical protein L228DRAFT_267833 [Xylona heveae TC161]KZF23875.1 hypothetical protein L228DRAFT_267833 [Xylona heveae TC161]
MGFVGVYTAIYDYSPQGENELSIKEGDLLYILEKSTEDDWWKAKKKAGDDEEEEPLGLIPNNYVEEAQPTANAKALYDYTRQTDEELSFTEEAILSVYDTSDPDWTLIGLNGEYGFAPANYIEISESAPRHPPASVVEQQPDHTRSASLSSAGSPLQSPAAALADIIHRKASEPAIAAQSPAAPQYSSMSPPSRPADYTPEESDDEVTPPAPVLPQRPQSLQISPPSHYTKPLPLEPPGVVASPPYNRLSHRHVDEAAYPSPGGYHLYNINEMVSAMGKRKKLPTTLGINIGTGTIMISPEKSRDGPQQEWTADKLTHYSIEGKHVFLELVRPSKSVDFHAGAKDTAQEIVAALGDMAGAVRAEGLREVIAAGSGTGSTHKKGQMLYDFMAQGEDEVTVAVGDEVIVLDDSKSEEWWMVRRLKNGKEGVVPSSYVELTGTTSVSNPSTTGINAGRSAVEQNRLEEERLAKEAIRSSRKRGESDPRVSEVGPGMRLPARGSSLAGHSDGNELSTQRSRHSSRSDAKAPSTSKPKPDASKTRTWTDRSGSFKVEAEFIGLKDGKIHLHKLNGVKIAVPVPKMSVDDLEYVERVTGVSLDEDKPLSDIRHRNLQKSGDRGKARITSAAGASVGPVKPEYDWFDFFLSCGVGPHLCERYAANFVKDSMDEGILPDITPEVLRTLGLKEGDILRVMKYLDNKFGRAAGRTKRNVSFGGAEVIGKDDEGEDEADGAASGGLFSGPGGALRNNTRKGRPAPPVQTNDVVDEKVFEQKKEPNLDTKKAPTPLVSAPSAPKRANTGFDDDAWDVKPSKQQPQPPARDATPPPATQPAAQPAPPQQPTLTGSMKELSLLSPPLEPAVVHTTGAQQAAPPPAPVPQTQTQAIPPAPQPPQPQAQVNVANPSFFAQLGQQKTGPQFQSSVPQPGPVPTFAPQQTGFSVDSPSQPMPPRQRPQPPPAAMAAGSLVPPPPARPFSAPQNPSQPNGFGPPPLQPQLTGYQGAAGFQPSVAPPGQSLNEINQQKLQQQFAQQQIQPQMTGFGQQQAGVGPFMMQQQQPGFGQPVQAQPTGFQQAQPFLNGQQTGSPFANPPPQQPAGFQAMLSQPTGFQTSFSPQPIQQQQPQPPQLQPQMTGSVNSFLPPALQPQQTGVSGFGGQGFGQVPPPPPVPQPPPMQPLQPQKTGPAPPVRFGVAPETKRLTPQPTGRKANLAQATPQNPFGF